MKTEQVRSIFVKTNHFSSHCAESTGHLYYTFRCWKRAKVSCGKINKPAISRDESFCDDYSSRNAHCNPINQCELDTVMCFFSSGWGDGFLDPSLLRMP